MLLRMYLRWAERRGFDFELDEVSAGTEAGISSATFIVKGRYAYGLLRAEQGVHRLVRICPFNAQGKRQTRLRRPRGHPVLEDAATSRSTRRTCASTPTARRAPAASTST